MKNIKKDTKIIIFLIITLLILLAGGVKAGLKPEGQPTGSEGDIDAIKNNEIAELNLRSRDLIMRNDLYCVQYGAPFSGTKAYYLNNYIEINKDSSVSEKAIAYLLWQNRDYGYSYSADTSNFHDYTDAQRAIYNIIASESLWGIDYYNNNNMELTEGAYNLRMAADEYARSSTSATASITDQTNKSNVGVTVYNTDSGVARVRVGPFNWKYAGALSDVHVYDQADSEIGVSYSRFEGSNEIFFGANEIPNEGDFYITLDADPSHVYIKNITAHVSVENPEIYTARIWILYSDVSQYLMLTDVGSEPGNSTDDLNEEYNIPITKNINLHKVDSRNQEIPLSGVGFIFYNKEMGKYVSYNGIGLSYVDRESATTFYTDANGNIYLQGLVMGTYDAIEVSNPHYGYELITITIPAEQTEITAINEQKYIKLSGYVWKDVQSGKQSLRNDLYKNDSYDYEDTAFNGIIVRLRDTSGNILAVTTSKELGLYSEIDGGEYQFEGVEISKLSNYYVEFEYNGLIYQSVAVNLNNNNGSKATDVVERTILDRNFANVNSTGANKVNVNNIYSISYNTTQNHSTSVSDSSQCILHARTNDAGYYIQNYFSPTMEMIKYINLGLYEKPQADLALAQDLENAKVGVNGYWHTYRYATRSYENNSGSWNVGVKFKNDYTGTYRRAIYESDLYYNPDDSSKELQVYLTYKIAIKNESSYLTKANNIVDYFDNRYTLVGAGTGIDGNSNITGPLNCGTVQNYSSEYQKCIIDVNTTVKSGEANYVYVQFKLSRSAVLEIMNNNETLYNVSEVNSYTVYKDNNGNTVAAVDKDSVPGNSVVGNINTYEDDTDAAPPVKLEITNPRGISGTTFVDSTSGELKTGEIRQGSGTYESGETLLSGVKVALHNKLDGSVAQIYNSDTDKWEDAVIETDGNGNFSFNGYIPGQYVLTYTWGNSTYTVQNYKGTVYDSARNQNNMYWYKDNVNVRKTDAIDDYQERLNIDEQMAAITDNTINGKIVEAYKEGYVGEIINKMNSTTPTMEFGVEYDTTVTDGTIDKVEFIVGNVDFGIVERAKQQLDLTKRVKTFKITLANGQILVDATVNENGTLSGSHDHVTYMGPSASNGYTDNGFIKAEIDNELIEGAVLEVGYEIKAINNSEMDYMTENYYKYGTDRNNPVTLTPSAVVDYLDKNLGFETDKNPDWKQITVDELKTLNAVKVGDTEFLNSRLILYTEATAVELEPTETSSANLNVSKLLTTSNELTFNNDAETVKITKPKGSTPKGSTVKYFPADEAEEVEITPSTGENKAYIIPVAIGITALIILGVGTLIIKKKIMDK